MVKLIKALCYSYSMHKGRLEAFSDGVIAILITIMVLELKVPAGHELADLKPLLPTIVSYALSFVFLAIYWNNHHHMLQAAHKVNGKVLWANSHLLFWLSLIPFTTSWMDQHKFAAWPVASYGIVLLLSAIAYYILALTLVSHHGKDSAIAKALGNDFKAKISIVIYLCAIPLAFFHQGASYGCYVLVAMLWLYPDKRIERALEK